MPFPNAVHDPGGSCRSSTRPTAANGSCVATYSWCGRQPTARSSPILTSPFASTSATSAMPEFFKKARGEWRTRIAFVGDGKTHEQPKANVGSLGN